MKDWIERSRVSPSVLSRISSLYESYLVLPDHFRRSGIPLNLGPSYDTLDGHETAVGQYVSTTHLDTYHLPPFSLDAPSFWAQHWQDRPTSIIAVATIAFAITMRGALDRPDEVATTNAYIGAGKMVVNLMGYAARTRSGWLLWMRSDRTGREGLNQSCRVCRLAATILYYCSRIS